MPPRKLIEKLLADFESSGTQTLLLSSEFFFPAIEQLDHLLPGAEFLAYLRDPLESFESDYNQRVKRHGMQSPLGQPPKIPLGIIGHLRRLKQERPQLKIRLRPYAQPLFVGGA